MLNAVFVKLAEPLVSFVVSRQIAALVYGQLDALLSQYLRRAEKHRVKDGAGRYGGKRGQLKAVQFQTGFIGAAVVVQRQVRRVKKH